MKSRIVGALALGLLAAGVAAGPAAALPTPPQAHAPAPSLPFARHWKVVPCPGTVPGKPVPYMACLRPA